MTLGDGIRRNIASVDPSERALFIDALTKLNTMRYEGTRNDLPVPGGVTWWYKQDEIHQATHVHGGPEFIPWHREMVNRFEELLRRVNPQLSLHYWDWTQDPRRIPNANLGNGRVGILNLFTNFLMGYGGGTDSDIDQPWLDARFYVPEAKDENDPNREPSDPIARESSTNPADPDRRHGNPADPPRSTKRRVNGSPASNAEDDRILIQVDFANMHREMIPVHDRMHGFVAMGDRHRSFEDPFVFLLHSNVDRLFARWQTDPEHPERLKSDRVYGSLSPELVNTQVEPWSTGRSRDGVLVRPWCAPENEGVPHTYSDKSIVSPPSYDTNHPLPERPKGVSSGPFIQSKFGRQGDFEMIVPQFNGLEWTLIHYSRENDKPNYPWSKKKVIFTKRAPDTLPKVTAAYLIQSNFGSGNLEVVARMQPRKPELGDPDPDYLYFFWYNADTEQWSGSDILVDGNRIQGVTGF